MMFSQQAKPTYKHEAQGTWGVFHSPGGKVAYLMTKARLGSSGIDNERRLTSQLRPVREVLDVHSLNFNQLLQRDLDDHRIASALLPYLLKNRATGPAFFPPIVAALLPFADNRPAEQYPICDSSLVPEDELTWQERQYGAALRFRSLADKEGHPHHIKLGTVAWNDEHARVMVIDGQHRAMALLAIERTVLGTWDRDGANRYKHFYEHQIRQLLGASGAPSLEDLEIPVTLLWFPEMTHTGTSAQKAARQLFVDINKEARAPSEARLILLSDAELVNVLTRSLLNRIREPAARLPLYAIEYDNPLRDAELPSRWSVLTNINLLKTVVTYCVFGPAKYTKNVGERFSGRLPWPDMNQWARTQLGVSDLFPERIEDSERVYERDELGNTYFPVGLSGKLSERFLSGWGEAILTMLSDLAPYSAHVKALKDQYANWATDDALGSLAKDALFEGVGMYWTLRDANAAWLDRKRATPTGQVEPSKPDVVKAWDILTDRRRQFAGARALALLQRANTADVERSEEAFAVYNTHACQLGIMLTIATLRDHTSSSPDCVARLAGVLVNAWNATLRAPGRNRITVLSRKEKHPLNMVGKMDTPLAVYFRYMWLELLRTPEAAAICDSVVSQETIRVLAEDSRALYVNYLEQEHLKAIRRMHPEWGEARSNNEARAQVTKKLKKALAHWFGRNDAEYDDWEARVRAANTAVSVPTPENGHEVELPASSDASEASDVLPGADDEDD